MSILHARGMPASMSSSAIFWPFVGCVVRYWSWTMTSRSSLTVVRRS